MNGICTKCKTETCTRCTNDANICNSCDRGHFLQQNECISCKQPHCETCNKDRCFECSNNYIIADGGTKCLSCLPNCMDCSNDIDSCEDCDYKFGWTGNACEKCPGENCTYCKTKGEELICSGCGYGYRLNTDSHVCEKCRVPDCYECSDSTDKCSQCQIGYPSANGDDCLPCPEHCETCSADDCQMCSQGYFYLKSTKKCEKGPDNCYVPGSIDKCHICNNNYILEVTSEQLKSPTPQNINGSGCTNHCESCTTTINGLVYCITDYICPNNTYLNAYTNCVSCGGGCDACTKNGCSSCTDDYWLQLKGEDYKRGEPNYGECVSSCSTYNYKHFCFSDHCPSNMLPDGEKCIVDCGNNCGECALQGCSSCKQGFLLKMEANNYHMDTTNYGVCVDACAGGYIYDGKICFSDKCPEGMKTEGDKCVKNGGDRGTALGVGGALIIYAIMVNI